MATSDGSDNPDLSDGEVSPKTVTAIDEELSDGKQRRLFRHFLFWPFGLFAVCMFGCLYYEIVILLEAKNLQLILASKDWHSNILIASILILMACIPLSIFVSLIKLQTKPGDKKEEDGVFFSSPQVETLKFIASLVKPGKE